MAYPDFTTSTAPDFVSNILRIPRDFNDMANANARTQIAQQQAQTAQWLAQIEAARKRQEIANDPQVQAREQALAESRIATATASTDLAKKSYEAGLTEQGYQNLMTELKLKQAQAGEQNRITAIEQTAKLSTYNNGAPITVDDYMNPEVRQKITSGFDSKYNTPGISEKVYDDYAVGKKPYANAIERSKWDKYAQDAYKNYLGQSATGDEEAAMAETRADNAVRQATMELRRKIILEEAKAAGRAKPAATTMTDPEVKRADDLVGEDKRARSMNEQQRAAYKNNVGNVIVQSRTTGGLIPPAAMEAAYQSALKGEGFQSDVDRVYDGIP